MLSCVHAINTTCCLNNTTTVVAFVSLFSSLIVIAVRRLTTFPLFLVCLFILLILLAHPSE